MTTETTRRPTATRNGARTETARPRAGGRSSAPRTVTGGAPARPAAPPPAARPATPPPSLSLKLLELIARVVMHAQHRDHPSADGLLMCMADALANRADPRTACNLSLALAEHAASLWSGGLNENPAWQPTIVQLVALSAKVMRLCDPLGPKYAAAVRAAGVAGFVDVLTNEPEARECLARVNPEMLREASAIVDAAATPAHTEADRAAVKAAMQ